MIEVTEQVFNEHFKWFDYSYSSYDGFTDYYETPFMFGCIKEIEHVNHYFLIGE